jgi:lysophospholipase L1-like esterase
MAITQNRRIGLALGAVAVALVSCELMARIVFPAPPDPTRQPQIVYQADPEIRYRLMANQRGWIDDGFVTTNSLGIRGPEIAVPKPSGRFRIVAIGDSVTFGWGVNDADTFCAQLEQRLRERSPARDLDVVNLAVGGYNTRQEVALLARHVARLQPDLVLVGFYSNDVAEAFDDKDSMTPPGPAPVATGGDGERVLHLNPAPSSWADAQMRRSRAVYTIGRVVNRLVHKGEWGRSGFSMELDLLAGRDSAQLAAAWEGVARQFGALRSIATARHFGVAVVVLPPREQVLGAYPQSHYQTTARALAEPLGFLVIDPLPALSRVAATAGTLFIPYDRNHPSAAGHRLLAQTIADALDESHGLSKGPKQVAGNGSGR